MTPPAQDLTAQIYEQLTLACHDYLDFGDIPDLKIREAIAARIANSLTGTPQANSGGSEAALPPDFIDKLFAGHA